MRQWPADVLLGRDVLLGKGVPLLEYTLERMETDEIKQTLQRMLQKGVLNPEAIIAEASEKYVLAVETRAQKIKRLEEEVQTRNQENESGGKPSSFRTSDIEDVQPAMSESSVVSSEKSEEAAIDTQESEESAITEEDEESPFDSFSEELFGESRPCREKLSKAQKRHQDIERRTQHQEMKIGELQEQDPELRKLEEGDKTCRYYRKNGILFGKGTPRGSQGEEYEQLVVPRKYRAKVLQLAHSIPLAGHMGQGRTATRILKRFFWPNSFKDVADYCHSCPECQKAARKTGQRAPMIPLPIMGQPFERIAMDIVRPLPRSIKSYKYILVVCDYATRYPRGYTTEEVYSRCSGGGTNHIVCSVWSTQGNSY